MEGAEKQAKSATNDEQIADYPIPAADIKNLIKQKLNQTWKQNWTDIQNNKLRYIKNDVTEWTTP